MISFKIYYHLPIRDHVCLIVIIEFLRLWLSIYVCARPHVY
jgi:hypothetical protein